jgi:hypothetical protein
MTAAKSATPEFEENADVTVAPSDWQWDTVRTEVPTGVVFEKPGEEFIGRFERKQHVERDMAANGEDKSFDLFVFTGRDNKPYSLSSSFALEQAYEDELFKVGDWCRIAYVKDVKTSRGQNDMKDLRIDVRK